jgi:hypothetical protein
MQHNLSTVVKLILKCNCNASADYLFLLLFIVLYDTIAGSLRVATYADRNLATVFMLAI